MDSIIFYNSPLDALRPGSAASRFPACREAAVAPPRVPRSSVALGGGQCGPTATTGIPWSIRPKDTPSAKQDAGTFPKQVAERSPLASSGR